MSGSDLAVTVDGESTSDATSSEIVAFHSPSELAALAESLFRGVFGSGLVVSCLTTAYALILSSLQPGDSAVAGVLTCGALLVLQLLLVWRRCAVYELLRRRPQAILLPALALAFGAGLTGVHNDQYFFVLTIFIGVLGVATPLRWVSVASLVAAFGVAAPAVIDEGSVGTAVFAVVVPPIFWLIVNRLALFLLGLHEALTQRSDISGGRVADAEAEPHVVIRRARWPHASRRQLPERAFSLHDWESQSSRIRRIFRKTDMPLTARQQQAVFYCCDGLEDAEIAEAMSISIRQVRRYLADARERTNTATREQLAAWAVALGLVP